MLQPSRAVRSSSPGLARALLVLVRWTALITFVGFVSFTAFGSTHLRNRGGPAVGEKQLSGISNEVGSADLQHQLRRLPTWRRFEEGRSGRVDEEEVAVRVQRGTILDSLRRRWEKFYLYKEKALDSRNSELEVPSQETLRLELRHRDAPGSPLRKEFSNRAEEVAEILARDASRITGMHLKQHIRGIQLSEYVASKDTLGSNFKAPLFSGSPLGTGSYLVDFYLGTPPQRFSLIADTGSDLTWTQCAPCADCYPQLHPLYNPANSSSFSPIPCDSHQCELIPAPETFPTCVPSSPIASPCFYRYQYSGATSFTEGIFAQETATMKAVQGSAVKIKGIAFGCGNIVNQGSFGKADGILGLGQGPISFPQQIKSRYGSKFAYCLLDFSKPTTTTSLLIFGAQSDLLLANRASVSGSQIQYTQLLSNAFSPTFYYVRPVKVSVDGKFLPIRSRLWQFDAAGNGGSVFESGVTLTYLVTSIYKEVYKAFEAAVPYPRAPAFDATLQLCFNVNGVKKLNLPLLKIWFKDGAVYEPPKENIFVNVGEGISCLAIGEVASPISPNIFGNLLQQNFFIVFDQDKRRIGFAPSMCSF